MSKRQNESKQFNALRHRCPFCNGTLRYRSTSDDYRCRKCGETWGHLSVALHDQEQAASALSLARGETQ